VSQLWVFLALAFSIVIAIFAVQNNSSVEVRFLMLGPVLVAVSVLVLISAALGAGIMLLLGMGREMRLRWRQRQVGQQLRTAQGRVAELEAAQQATPATPAPEKALAEAETEPIPSPRTAP
jgi:uncharacterized integral membrane protein